MKQKLTLLILALFTAMGVWAQPDVSGKTFTLQCKRGYVYYNGSRLAGTSEAASASEFALVKYESDTYLYDATNKAFVCHTTAATAGTTGNPALESNNDFSKAVKNISFGSTEIVAYPYYVQEDEFENWLNMDGVPYVYFNTWKDFEGGNGGNTYAVAIVDDSFDDSEAFDMLDAYFNPSATVTYVISDGSGVIYTSEAVPATIGETITALPSEYQRPYCTYSVTSTEVVTGNNNVPVTLTEYNPPFTVSSSFATATWYYATLRGSKYLRADESHKDGNGRYQTNTTNERTDVYKWAFVGNPYQLTIVNKNAGDSKVLYAGDVPVMQAATPASDNKARWIVSSNSNGGFNVRSESGANLYINDAGGGGNLGYWNSSWAASDGGSNWVVSEVATSDKAVLSSAINTAQALIDNVGTPGYLKASATSTISTLTSAIATAQSVYDDPSGDWVSAAGTLTSAIATATATENIEYTPRTDVYYTIVNARGAMVYDPTHDASVDATNDDAKYIWYGSTTPDASNVNNLWGFIEQDGHYYMYNVGKQQFATVGAGTYGATWIFSDVPAYITLDDGIADEIAAPKVRVRATIATTSSTYTMSVSTSYTGPVITYDANGDGGVPMLFAESATSVDADVTDIMVSKVTDLTPYKNVLKDLIDACAAIPTGTGLNQYAETSAYTTALAAAETVYADGDATKSDLQTATSDLESAIEGLTINLPGTGFYRIKGKTSEKYLAAGLAANGKFNMTTATDATTIFYYDGTKLTNLGSGLCNGATSTAWAWVDGANACTVTFQDGKDFRGYAIQSSDINFYDNGDGANSADRGKDLTISSGTNARYCSWELAEITTLPVAMKTSDDANYFATVKLPVAVTVPSGVSAYEAAVSGTTLSLTKVVEDGVLAANEPVILYSNSDVASLAISDAAGTAAAANELEGTIAAETVTANDNYVLGVKNSVVGFYKYGGTTMPGFKAYLPVPSSPVKAFTFSFEDIQDAIRAIESENNNLDIYDIAGRRVQKAQKGLYIVNGKKVMYK